MKKVTVLILFIALTMPLFGQNRSYAPKSRNYNYRQNEKKAKEERLKQRTSSKQKKAQSSARPMPVIIGIFAAGGATGSGSGIVYDPTLFNQTVKYEIAPSYSYGVFINLFQGWITELSYNYYEVKHAWYDDYGKVEYNTPVANYGLTTGYRLTWPGFYHTNRKTGSYPFIMAGGGIHWCTSRPEAKIKIKVDKNTDELDLDWHYSNRLKIDMNQLQWSLTWGIGNEFVFSRYFSIGIGIKGTCYFYLYKNDNAKKTFTSDIENDNNIKDLSDFSKIIPATVQLFITASLMF